MISYNFEVFSSFDIWFLMMWIQWLLIYIMFSWVICNTSLKTLFFIFIVYIIKNVPIFSYFAHLLLPSPTPSLWPSPHCCLCLCVMHVCSLANFFTFFHPDYPLFSDSCQFVPRVHASASILFISLFCSLDSTYKWDHNGVCLSLSGLFHSA